MNELNKEFVENYAKMNQLYKQHFEDMQRMNQQWFNLFWRPFMQQQQEQENKEGQAKNRRLIHCYMLIMTAVGRSTNN
jgi:hypothetical protein